MIMVMLKGYDPTTILHNIHTYVINTSRVGIIYIMYRTAIHILIIENDSINNMISLSYDEVNVT